MVVFPVLVSAQKYLSKEMDEVSKEWNGQTFSSNNTLSENLADVSQFSIMAEILKDPTIWKAIEKEEMVTVFLITDAAFYKLDKKEREALLKNKTMLKSMMNYLIVPGRIDQNGMEVSSQKHNGIAYLATLSGERLGVLQEDGTVYLVDSKGRKAALQSSNFYHKNGLFHIIDDLVFPSSY